MKKLFGGINLTWKKLIISAVFAGIYTAIMALLPITKDTSFRDVAICLDAWIVCGIIIICNSKSPLDSALKCFVFFLISQPIIYLLQVPFSEQGFQLFGYYRYWFLLTLACFPMGYVGYYIKKNDIFSVIILMPMLLLLSYFGFSYLNQCLESFPHHLLSCIFCFGSILIIVLCLFNKKKHRIISFGLIILISAIYLLKFGGLINKEFEVYKSLEEYNLPKEVYVTHYNGTKKGNVELVELDNHYNVKLTGVKKGEYEFKLSDESNNEYLFKYYFDKENNTVILEEIKTNN